MRKGIVFITAVFLLCTCLSGCGSNREMSLEKILQLETKEDVCKLFGESTSEADDKHEVFILDSPLDAFPTYDGENNLLRLMIFYELIGMRDIELAMEMLDYQATREDIKAAEEFAERLLEHFTEELGKPRLFYSPVETVTYTWEKDEITIELVNALENDLLLTFDPISIRITYY